MPSSKIRINFKLYMSMYIAAPFNLCSCEARIVLFTIGRMELYCLQMPLYSYYR